MSCSTDSLKKKVCVTVFLDELFEEVYDEDPGDTKQVSEMIESEMKTSERTCGEPSEDGLNSHEKGSVCPKASVNQSEVPCRPRKHRKESKFSKNHYDSFKNELDKYGYISRIETESRNREAIEFAFSDNDLEECLKGDKKLFINSSFSEASELTEDSSTVEGSASSATVICCKESVSKLDTNIHSCTIIYRNRSTQFDLYKTEIDKTDQKSRDEILLQDDEEEEEEEQYEEDDDNDEDKAKNDLAWKRTQNQIQLILARAKARYQEKEACEEDSILHYDLKSILEDCVNTVDKSTFKNHFSDFQCLQPNTSTDFSVLDFHELSDSYTCVFPHNKKRNRSSDLKRLWASKRGDCIGRFESDLSRMNFFNHPKPIDFRSIENESLFYYTLCLKCQESLDKNETNVSLNKDQFSDQSQSTSTQTSFDILKSRSFEESAEVLRTLNKLVDDMGIGIVLNEKKDENNISKKEGGWEKDLMIITSAAEGRSKNYAEGDTFEQNLLQKSDLKFNTEEKQGELIYDEIFKHVDETSVVQKEIVVNHAEVQVVPKSEYVNPGSTHGHTVDRSVETIHHSQEFSKRIAEVFVKALDENEGRTVSDVESEMIFAESENFCDSEGCLTDRINVENSKTSYTQTSGQNVCVVEFEDKLSRSKMLKRIKTVEFVGADSVSDMKNISTEVILVCENISNSDVCLEAWQTSVSTLKGLTEMGQCYLKDSKDSSMYLIEIPLHFTHLRSEKVSDTE